MINSLSSELLNWLLLYTIDLSATDKKYKGGVALRNCVL